MSNIIYLIINIERKIILSNIIDNRRNFYLKGGDNIIILTPLRSKQAIELYY